MLVPGLVVTLVFGACSSSTPDSSPTTSAAARTTTEAVVPDDTTAETPPASSEALQWTVIAVDGSDALNVREEPNSSAAIVGTFSPWETGVVVSDQVVVDGDARWRSVQAPSGVSGWVNARFLVAQPFDFDPALDGNAMIEQTEAMLAFALSGGSTGPEAFTGGRGMWVGGTGIYGDGHNGWEFLSADDLENHAAWVEPRTFSAPFGSDSCGGDCVKSVVDYLGLDRLDDRHSVLVDDIGNIGAGGFYDGALYEAPTDLHRTVIVQPESSFIAEDGSRQPFLDWQRIHLVFDWSTGTPRIALIQTWGWTP